MLDASVAVDLSLAARDPHVVADEKLVAPSIMWSETRSVLHEARWRGDLDADVAFDAARRLQALPVERRDPADLGPEAWRVADELGWAKTYDAEYVALARLLGCRLLTSDLRMRRGAGRLGFVIVWKEL